jgi:hypothetical protein
MRLREDHVALATVLRPPIADTPLQGSAHAGGDLRVATPDLFIDGDRAQIGRGLDHRHDLFLPNALKRIGTPASSGRLLLRWRAWIIRDPVAGCGAETGLGGGHSRGVCLAKTHEQPHLVVVDVEAGQASIPLCSEESYAWPSRSRPPDAVPLE